MADLTREQEQEELRHWRANDWGRFRLSKYEHENLLKLMLAIRNGELENQNTGDWVSQIVQKLEKYPPGQIHVTPLLPRRITLEDDHD